MKKKVAILIIDVQNDFCDPKGSLFVPGAVEDSERLSHWINYNKEDIDYIGVTIDSHQVMDIAHKWYWVDEEGNHPSPYTVITVDDVKNSVWRCVKQKKAIKYLQALEEQGEYAHIIWPEHCVIGTWGNAINESVSEAVLSWAKLGRHVNYVSKGSNPLTEHYGAFEAQIPIEGVESTQYNTNLQKSLERCDVVYLAGQAKNFCVLNTLKQIIDRAPDLAKKLVILDDCMSDVPGFDGLGKEVWEKARMLGVRFSESSKEILANSGV